MNGGKVLAAAAAAAAAAVAAVSSSGPKSGGGGSSLPSDDRSDRDNGECNVHISILKIQLEQFKTMIFKRFKIPTIIH